jgi:hypothetical protein
MNRRGFLAAFGSATLALAGSNYMPSAWLWNPSPEVPVMPSPAFTLDWFMYDFLKEFERQLPYFTSAAEGAKIGEDRLTDQINIAVAIEPWLYKDATDPRQAVFERIVKPAACAMAQTAVQNRMQRFGKLPLPLGVEQATTVTSNRSGISVRAIRGFYWDPMSDPLHNIRLDIVGGPA